LIAAGAGGQITGRSLLMLFEEDAGRGKMILLLGMNWYQPSSSTFPNRPPRHTDDEEQEGEERVHWWDNHGAIVDEFLIEITIVDIVSKWPITDFMTRFLDAQKCWTPCFYVL
jgi:hypothetical protein